MQEKIHHTTQGSIHYWTDACAPGPMTLVLLPGLTADHRLFDRQIEAFRGGGGCWPGTRPAMGHPGPLPSLSAWPTKPGGCTPFWSRKG